MYVLHVVISDVTKRCGETVREKAKGNTNGLSHVPSKRKEEIKSGTSGCGSFVGAYFQPATSIDGLHSFFCQGKEEASWPDIVWNKNKMHTELWVTRSFPALGLANIPHYEQIVFFNMNMHIIIYSHTYIARQWSIYTHHMHPQHSHKHINTHTHTWNWSLNNP